MNGRDFRALLEQRIAKHLREKQDQRQAPDEVIRRTVKGERVVTRRHKHA